MWGISYPGLQTVWGMIDAHPALKAASPQAPAIDMFLGDDFHHNGAFRLMYAFSWLAGNARPRTGARKRARGGFDYGTPDGYRFFLEAGPVANINENYFNGQRADVERLHAHPNYDEYWKRQNVLKHLTKNITPIRCSTSPGGSTPRTSTGRSRPIERSRRTRNKNRIVVGPWLHGGWARCRAIARRHPSSARRPRELPREIELPFFRST